jgi:hypothetical protein
MNRRMVLPLLPCLSAILVGVLCLAGPGSRPAGEAKGPATAGARPAARPPPAPRPGPTTAPGPRGEPRRRVRTLLIDKPGVYEDVLVDAGWADADAVRVRADGVTLRHCEIRNGLRDGVEVYAADVLIEGCRIHHFLAGTLKEQKDAHGVTGRPTRLTVRDCEIGFVSGDCLQFDPGRGAWTDVVIENCRLYAGPLPADAAGFKAGEQPGENAVDTKQKAANPRSKMTVRNCVLHGFSEGGPITNRAALNLKNHVEVTVENCVFYDNELCLRLRGPSGAGEYGGAFVTASDCSFYNTPLAIRAEDGIKNLTVLRPRFGAGVGKKVRHVGGPGPGFRLSDEQPAPDLPR